MDNRGVTPVVEKAVTMGIVLLFIGGVTTTLFGTSVPAYRDAVGAEVGERVLSTAVREVETAVPPNGTAVSSRTHVELPPTLRGTGYGLHVDGRSLVMTHPDPAIGGRARLSLPTYVTRITGDWQSGAETVVGVNDVDGGVAVVLEER